MRWWTMATEWAVSRPGSPRSPVAGLRTCGGPFQGPGEAHDRAGALEEAHHRNVVARARDPERYDPAVHAWLAELRFGAWSEEDLTTQRRLGARVHDAVISAEDIERIADASIEVRRAAAVMQMEAARRSLELEPDDEMECEADCHGMWRAGPRYAQRPCQCLVTNWWLIVIGAPTDAGQPVRVDVPVSDIYHLKSGGGHGYRADGRPTCFLEIGTQRHGFFGIGFGAIDDPEDWTPAWLTERSLRKVTRIRPDPDENGPYLHWLRTRP